MSVPQLPFLSPPIRAAEPSRTLDCMKSSLGERIEPFTSRRRPVRLIVGVRRVLSSDRDGVPGATAGWVKILTPPPGKPRLTQLHGPTHSAFGVATTLTIEGTCPMNSAEFLADNPYARFGDLAVNATVDTRKTFIRKT